MSIIAALVLGSIAWLPSEGDDAERAGPVIAVTWQGTDVEVAPFPAIVPTRPSGTDLEISADLRSDPEEDRADDGIAGIDRVPGWRLSCPAEAAITLPPPDVRAHRPGRNLPARC